MHSISNSTGRKSSIFLDTLRHYFQPICFFYSGFPDVICMKVLRRQTSLVPRIRESRSLRAQCFQRTSIPRLPTSQVNNYKRGCLTKHCTLNGKCESRKAYFVATVTQNFFAAANRGFSCSSSIIPSFLLTIWFNWQSVQLVRLYSFPDKLNERGFIGNV